MESCVVDEDEDEDGRYRVVYWWYTGGIYE
jgi:hypothetical protein